MSRLAGIIYPSAFQVTEMIGEMHAAFPDNASFQYYHHKNLELGAWDTHIATNPPKNLWAMLDGTIYNAEELRSELTKLGFEFRTNDDTEVILHAYDAWKEEFLQKLNGPFALAIFDETKQTLLLARDPLGQKPLYWTTQGDYWLFSTELKGLIATGAVPQTPALDALASYLYFGFIPQDLSAIQGVNKLLPCHYLKVNLKRQSVIGQHWSLSEELNTKAPLSEEETYQKLGARLEEAVRTSLPEKGNIGSSLDGTLGSSAMTWFLSHTSPRERLQTYTSAFTEPKPASVEISSKIAEILALPHTATHITPEEALTDLPKIIWHLDEPIADMATVQTWNLGKLAQNNCHAIYADLGWEEMMGGSSRYFTSQAKPYPRPSFAYLLAKLPPAFRDRYLLPTLKFLRADYLFNILRNIDIDRDQVTYLMESALFKGKGRKKVSPTLYKAFNPAVFAQRFHRLNCLPGSIDPSLYYDAKTELPDRLLVQYERLLSPHNINVINPFLDKRLVTFLAHIPEEIKFDPKKPGALLSTLMEKLCHTCPPFPEQSDTYLDTWCKDPHMRHIFGLLEKGRLVDEGLISAKWIRQQLGYPYLIPRTFKQLWAILILEVWFRLYINRPISADIADLSLEELLQQ